MKYAIIGTGAVGGFYGGKLANAEDERGAKRTFETSGVCNLVSSGATH